MTRFRITITKTITLSHKGVHLTPIYMVHDDGFYPAPKTTDLRSSTIRFDFVEYVTSLTQVIHPPVTVVGPMVLNVLAHVEGLEVGNFFGDSVPSINVKMSEYQGQSSDLTVQQIPPVLVGNDIGNEIVRIRRVSDPTESPNGLVPPVRSSPRSLASVPPHFLENTQANLFGKCFLQIIPLRT
jgi:hypothetical protein